MGVAIPMAVAVTATELTGVLAWWGIVLAAPVLVLRRRRRRRHGAQRRRIWPLAVRDRQAPPPTRDGPGAGAQEPLAAHPGRLAEWHEETRPLDGALASGGHTPPQRRTRSRADSGSGAGLSTETLEPLCRYVDFRRRLELAVAELERRLAPLPAERWRIEPYPLTGERRNTLLLLGETGVFVICATYAPGHWDDVIAADKLARKVQLLLPGYRGQVRPAICHPFTPTPPRLWHRPDARGHWVGAWLLGGDSVIDWLEHFGLQHGLSAADLARFDELAKSNWLKGAIPTAPSWPQIHEAPSAGSHE